MLSRIASMRLHLIEKLKTLRFLPKSDTEDFSRFFGYIQPTSKQLLLGTCNKKGVCIYVNDPTETTTGFYAIFRCIASESELEQRLTAKTVANQAIHTNRNTIFGIAITLATIFISHLNEIISLARGYVS